MIITDKYISVEVTEYHYKLKSYIGNGVYTTPIYIMALKTEGSIFSAIDRHLAHVDRYVGSGKYDLLDMASDRVRSDTLQTTLFTTRTGVGLSVTASAITTTWV
jgi:hypothetical protein